MNTLALLAVLALACTGLLALWLASRPSAAAEHGRWRRAQQTLAQITNDRSPPAHIPRPRGEARSHAQVVPPE